MSNPMMYNDPAGGNPSSIEGAGSHQVNEFYWQRRALIEMEAERYFTQLSDTIDMPKHYGKKIKGYHYLPLLDDRNVNDQGIDASGATIANGNLYGSSKDIGKIEGSIPTLGENGGRVNRVGFTRIMIEGQMANLGFFTEFTADSLDFDSDSEKYQHISREMVRGATQLQEAIVQKELLTGAGVIVYAGDATSKATISGQSTVPCEVDYDDMMRLNRILNENKCPKNIKMIKGSQLTDTRTIPGARVMYIGSELEKTVKGMTDLFGNPAFVSVEKYAAAGTTVNGEIGAVDHFRIVEVPEMQHWAAAGASATANPGYEESSGKYNVYPMLVVGAGSFSTIGFQTGKNSKGMKFKMITKMPGEKTADRTDPYGKTGFSSIQFWHGTLLKRSEWIGLILTLAKI